MLETIKIAFAATVFGFIGAILLSSLAARNLSPGFQFWFELFFQQCEVFQVSFGRFSL